MLDTKLRKKSHPRGLGKRWRICLTAVRRVLHRTWWEQGNVSLAVFAT